MQKIINVLALATTAVTVAVLGTAGYVYVNREAIIEDVKEKAMEAVLGGAGGLGGAAGLGGSELPLGSNDLAPSAPQAAAPSAPVQF